MSYKRNRLVTTGVPTALCFRHAASDRYRNIGDPGDLTSQESIVILFAVVRGWIARLVAFCDSGLFVQSGLSNDGRRIDYVGAEVDLAKRLLKPILALPVVFV